MPTQPSTAELQSAFCRSVLYGDTAIAPWIKPAGLSAERRMQVYRHIVENIFADALRTSFPAVEALVGDAFFGLAADRYLRAHPPCSGNLQEYGAAFADFLATMEEAAQHPYLPDIARLEWARQVGFLAPEGEGMPPENVAHRLRQADAAPLRLLLHPSLQLVTSDYPLFAIWRFATEQQGEPPDPASGGASLLIWRDGGQIAMQPIDPAEARFLRAVIGGEAMQTAWELTRAQGFPDFDLATLLPLLAANRLILDLHPQAMESTS